MSGQLSRSSFGEYQADERAGFAGIHLRVSGRSAGRCRGAPLASIRQMSGQVSRGSSGEYKADEPRSPPLKNMDKNILTSLMDGSVVASDEFSLLQLSVFLFVCFTLKETKIRLI